MWDARAAYGERGLRRAIFCAILEAIMFRTCEVRWFFPTAPPKRSVFVGGSAVSAPARTDWYATPANPKCGIKVRERRLEPKLLVQDSGIQTIGRAKARVQHWVKWSLDFPRRDFPADETLAATDWIAVEKRRFLRSFRCDRHHVTEVDGQQAAHCQLEWTELKVAGTRWWTIGLEAYAGRRLEEVLLSVTRHVVEDVPDATFLTEENSYSYPAWLCECVAI
jgi:hypothetical protein